MTDQEKAALWAKELLERNNWLIFDSETTGLGNDAQICQVGTLTSTNPEGWQTFVKPTIPIEPAATEVHGIKDEHVQNAPYFDEVLIPLMKIAANRDVVIFNAEFDLRMIRQSAKARGIQLAFPTSDRRGCRIFLNGGSIHCAMQWYSQWCGEWSDYHGNYRWQKLPGGDHSALGDCRATLEVIKRMAAAAPVTTEQPTNSFNDIAF